MCTDETKYCPRCQQAFECKSGNITQCQCYGVELTAELSVFIKQQFDDCLCRDCLKQLQNEFELNEEKHSDRKSPL
jgi:hypothetical protein